MEETALIAEIENELKEIIQIASIIQSKLDELNRMTKPDGFHALAVKEGLKFTKSLTKLLDFNYMSDDIREMLRRNNARYLN